MSTISYNSRWLQLREKSLNSNWPSIRRLHWVFMMTINRPFMKRAHNIVVVLLFERMSNAPRPSSPKWKSILSSMQLSFGEKWSANYLSIPISAEKLILIFLRRSAFNTFIMFPAHEQNARNGKINLRIIIRPTLAVMLESGTNSRRSAWRRLCWHNGENNEAVEMCSRCQQWNPFIRFALVILIS